MTTLRGILLLLFISILLGSFTIFTEFYDKPDRVSNLKGLKNMEHGLEFIPVCLDNVQYWYRRGFSGRSYLAVKMNPITLTPQNCPIN